MSVLKIEKLTKHFGGLTAVSDASLEIDHGQLIGLIGPNGAGKTTLFNLITGVYRPSEGKIYFSADSNNQAIQLNELTTDQIANVGVGRTFQNIRLFGDLSVLDNVKIGMHSKKGSHFFQTLFRTPSYYSDEHTIEAKSLELLEIFHLQDKANVSAQNLPYGDQRKLEIVRALATQPKLLFLDEPAAGMNPHESAELNALIHRIHEEFDLTIILIEHDMSVVMNVCEYIYVLEYGRLIAEGTPQEVRNNQRVIDAYLGGE